MDQQVENNWIYREAIIADIKPIQLIRNAVKENTLSNPSLVSDADVESFLFNRGKGWVCIIDQLLVGFSIVDMQDKNVWALFVHPDFEKKGIGKKLHDMMLNWYFQQTPETIWLGTAPATRAENFYRMKGWNETGTHGNGEIKFEMSFSDWKQSINNLQQ